MKDIIIRAQDKLSLRTFALEQGLMAQDEEDNFYIVRGFSWSWWAGTGKMLKTRGTEETNPEYLSGIVAIVRFTDINTYYNLVNNIKDNGIKGLNGTINYYELSGARLYDASDVIKYLQDNNLPTHSFSGGNTF